jgi:tRNA modification GTPase
VLNKSDKIEQEEKKALDNIFSTYDAPKIYISAKQGIALDDLRKMITEVAELPEVGDNDVTVTNMRHYEALKNALASIRRVNDGLASNISGDFLSQDLRECLQHIGEITGEITTDEVLGNIFKNFCIGK